MEESVEQAVRVIHESPTKAVIYVSGGASHALSWLLSVPGASGTVIECRVPYDRPAFIDAVGSEAAAAVNSYSSSAAARALAKAAYQRAVTLSSPGVRVCGVAAACALATTSTKKGDHRAFVATHTSDRVVEYELKLQKGHRVRWDEEIITSRLLLQALLDDCGSTGDRLSDADSKLTPLDNDALSRSHESPMSLVRDLLSDGDVPRRPAVQEHTAPIEAILNGDIKFAEFSGGLHNRDATRATLLFPGSFNPLHEGHKRLMLVAQARHPGICAAYEISVTNPDKPPLEPDDIRARMSQFDADETVLLTSAPLFSMKANMFPNAIFVIGADTALRIVDPKYYDGEDNMKFALLQMRMRGCKFLVAGRLDQRKGTGSRSFLTLHDVPVPLGFYDMFEPISKDIFREDVSSSEVRAKKRLRPSDNGGERRV